MKEGLNGEAVEVVGYWWEVTGNYFSDKGFSWDEEAIESLKKYYARMLGVLTEEPLMTIAQHQRLMAAKDAEIARLTRALELSKEAYDSTEALRVKWTSRALELSAQQSAPAERGVVLPAHKDERGTTFGDQYLEGVRDGWNACLDEVTSLNPAPAEQQPADGCVVVTTYHPDSRSYEEQVVSAPSPAAKLVGVPVELHLLLERLMAHVFDHADFDPTYPPNERPVNEAAYLYRELRALLATDTAQQQGKAE